jgi:TonB family protein
LNITLARFFGLSLALHAAVFVYLTAAHKLALGSRTEVPPISVSLLPPGQKASPPAAPPPARTKIAKTPALLAKKDSKMPSQQESAPGFEKGRANGERARGKSGEKATVAMEKPERNRDDQVAGLPVPKSAFAQKELPIDKDSLNQRQLPSVKDLLPPLTYSATEGHGSAPVSLNTKDPAYISYFNRIKQSIEQNWQYPELALRYGLQGKLSLEFAVGIDGQLEQLRIIRSSGSQLLDDEALRAIKAAAPFPPIPTWIKGNPLTISVTMEYNDNRPNFRYNR